MGAAPSSHPDCRSHRTPPHPVRTLSACESSRPAGLRGCARALDGVAGEGAAAPLPPLWRAPGAPRPSRAVGREEQPLCSAGVGPGSVRGPARFPPFPTAGRAHVAALSPGPLPVAAVCRELRGGHGAAMARRASCVSRRLCCPKLPASQWGGGDLKTNRTAVEL